MKRKTVQLITIFILAIFTFAVINPSIYADDATASGISAKLQELQRQYPNGTNQSKFYNSTYDGSACYRDLSGYCSWQCMAWGCKVFDTLWGMSIKKATFHQNSSDLYVGDFVRYRATAEYDHAIIITNIVGNKVYYTDCNGAGSSSRIQWNREPLTKADIKSLLSKQLYKSQFGYSYGYIVHCPNNNVRSLDSAYDYDDLGNDFWAKITHPATGFVIGKSSSGNAELMQSDENRNTYWHFSRQSDGTYIISNYGGGCLDVENFGTNAGTNVSIGSYNGDTAQRWYFTKNGDNYTVKALCAETVLDVSYNHNIQMYTANGTDAQKFSVTKITPFGGWITASGQNEVLPIYSSQQTVFNFDAAGATCFSISLKFPNGEYKEVYSGSEKTFSKQLPAGDYTAYISGQNNIGWTWEMNSTDFRVVDASEAKPSNGWLKITNDADVLYSDETITFTFDAKDAFFYDLWLYKDGSEREEIYSGYDRSVTKSLPSGKYRLTLSANNNVGWTYEFAEIEFEVADRPYEKKCEKMYDGRKYILYDIPLTWHQAKEYCEKQGGHLATVSDSDENEFIKSLILNGEKNGYWLGASDEDCEGTWKWVDDKTFLFSDWYGDNPNNSGGNEHYLEIRKDYGNQWNDDCDNKFSSDVLEHQGFICEFENTVPHTKSTVHKTENGYLVETKFINIPDTTAIIAAYSDGKLIAFKKIPTTPSVQQTDISGEFNNIKVLVWNKLKPVTNAEKIDLND